MIKVQLVKNALGTGGPYRAQVQQSGQYTLEDVAAEISARNIASPAVVRAVLNAVEDVIPAALLRGERVFLDGIVQLFPTIKGNYSGPDDSLAGHNQDLDIGVTVDAGLIKTLRDRAELEKVEANNLDPNITTLTGMNANLDALRPRDMFVLNGDRLYFDATRADEGVFFVSTEGEPDIKAYAFDIGDKRINVQTPDGLSPTTPYNIVVRARGRSSNPTSPLRSGTAPRTVTTA